LPQSVKFEGSIDGINYQEINTVSNKISIEEKTALFDFKTSFSLQSFKYIRVTAKNNVCPPSHPGAGKPGWLFVDELVVE
jgi:hexosaminidase